MRAWFFSAASPRLSPSDFSQDFSHPPGQRVLAFAGSLAPIARPGGQPAAGDLSQAQPQHQMQVRQAAFVRGQAAPRPQQGGLRRIAGLPFRPPEHHSQGSAADSEGSGDFALGGPAAVHQGQKASFLHGEPKKLPGGACFIGSGQMLFAIHKTTLQRLIIGPRGQKCPFSARQTATPL